MVKNFRFENTVHNFLKLPHGLWPQDFGLRVDKLLLSMVGGGGPGNAQTRRQLVARRASQPQDWRQLCEHPMQT